MRCVGDSDRGICGMLENLTRGKTRIKFDDRYATHAVEWLKKHEENDESSRMGRSLSASPEGGEA